MARSKITGRCGPPPGEGGAPRKPIDAELCRRLASIGCTMAEIAVACDVNYDTLFHRCDLEPELRTIIEAGREAGRTTLRRLQWQKAQTGDSTMLIWLGKQMLGQTEKAEFSGPGGEAISFVIRAPSPVESATEWLKLHAPQHLLEHNAEDGRSNGRSTGSSNGSANGKHEA